MFDVKQARLKLEARYSDLGRTAGENLEHWLSGKVPLVQREAVEAHFAEAHIPLLFDAFLAMAPFWHRGTSWSSRIWTESYEPSRPLE